MTLQNFRSSRSEVFLVKGVLKTCSKFTGEHLCRSVISKKLLCNFTEITLRHGCSPVNLLHIFRTPFTKNTSRWLLPEFAKTCDAFQNQGKLPMRSFLICKAFLHRTKLWNRFAFTCATIMTLTNISTLSFALTIFIKDCRTFKKRITFAFHT